MTEVYHNPDFLNYWRTKSVDFDTCELVAVFQNNSLDAAYSMTQNIDEPWRRDRPYRSTSVGDVIVLNGSRYIVDTFGFTPW